MNIFFGTSHLETLVDLKKVAEKHNCKLNFGFDSTANSDFDTNLLKSTNVNQEVIDFLEENSFAMKDINYSCDKAWFELCENTEDDYCKYHTMAYINENLAFVLDKNSFAWSLTKETEDVRELVQDFLDNTEYDNFYSFSDSPTIITGFGNKEKVTDYRVYRSGMALNYFADLVCEYLGEEKINRTY